MAASVTKCKIPRCTVETFALAFKLQCDFFVCSCSCRPNDDVTNRIFTAQIGRPLDGTVTTIQTVLSTVNETLNTVRSWMLS